METDEILSSIRTLQDDRFSLDDIAQISQVILSAMKNSTRKKGLNSLTWQYPENTTYLDLFPVFAQLGTLASTKGFRRCKFVLGLDAAEISFRH